MTGTALRRTTRSPGLRSRNRWMSLRARAENLLASVLALRGPGSVESSTVWMLGSPRTGSTWLLNLLRISPRVIGVDEPAIGSHLGIFAADVMGTHPASMDDAELFIPAVRAHDDQYFFCEDETAVWLPHLRRLLLARLDAYVRRTGPAGRGARRVLVVKEPAGSQAARMLFTALPRSRLLFLLRDGRDVIDSELDAVQKGGWLAEQFGSSEQLTTDQMLSFVRGQAHRWVARTEIVWRAYQRHDPRLRFLVRYEDLLADTAAVTSSILDWLELDHEPEAVRHHAAKLSFGSFAAEDKGRGKFARAATPGLWRKNLSPEAQVLVKEIMGPTLEALGYDADG